MSKSVELNGTLSNAWSGQRLDQALANLFPEYSRSRLQRWLKDGCVFLDEALAPAKYKVLGGEQVRISAELPNDGEALAENIPLDICYQDEHLLVVNKPVGLVVHPAVGNWSGTLLNGLLYYDEHLSVLPRGGIVHRLDKDTSGLMVVARTLTAHKSLVEQLQARTVHREYVAIVQSVLTAGGSADLPIGRHPKDRLRMAVVDSGKPAVTHYRVLERFAAHSLLEIRLETGRTHQIRVHMAHLHFPLVGDATYGGRPRLPAGISDRLRQAILSFPRQALHARKLELVHPESQELIAWECEPPEDFNQILAVLREET